LKAKQGSTEQRAVALWALAAALEGRHKAYSNVADFHERAQVIDSAISLLQDGDERLAQWTYELAITYNVITSKTNTTESRDLAIKHLLLVRQFIHDDDARQPYTCTWCSHLLSRRYWTSYDIKDAELAVRLVEHARSMMKREHFLARFAENTLFQALRALGYAHIGIFHSREDKSMADLEDAVAAFRQNLALRPVGANQHVRALNDLGNALGIIFKTCGDRVAGREALSIHQAAVDACPPGHGERYESLQKLGLALNYLSTNGSLNQDLSMRMSIFEEVLTLTPPGHSSRPDSLQFVAGVYRSQYFATQDGRWLSKAADALEESIRISPPGYVNRHQCLSIYASLLILRYQTSAGPEDLDKAEECAHEVIELIKPLHPALYRAYMNLAQIYLLRDAPHSMDHSIKWMLSVIQDPCADTRDRLQQVVIHLPRLRNRIVSSQGTNEQRQNLLKAYQQALQLIPQIAHIGLDVQTRLQDLVRTEQLAVDAAIVALICSRPETAVECLENGRAMFWAQGLALRASFEGIPHVIAAELREISQSLEAASLSSRGSADIGPSEDVAGMMRRKTTRYRVLLEEARKLPGMGRFLLNVGYPVLSTASKDGYIVILLADQLHSHAIAISPGGAARHIKLPNLTIEEVNGMGMFMREESMRYRSEMETACEEDETDRLMLRMKKPKSTAEITLAKLWSKIVEPIIHDLQLKVICFLQTQCQQLTTFPEIHGPNTTSYLLDPYWSLCVSASACCR
jgi:tetratricopeptide (TPR) repeat protein